MDNQNTRTKRNLILTALVILFFVAIIVLYYNMLNTETKSNIIKSGEINALNSVQQINDNINVGIDDIMLTSGTIDKMMQAKRSQDEITNYVIRQSAAVSDILLGSTTGLYGYINNEYVDGLGWVPGDDYIPTERSWYTEAMAHPGRVVVVDPYLDAYTGDMIVTLTKQLCDGKSVVAMDISMNQLQAITEDLTKKGDSDLEIILDRDYQVITHSDKTEVGKNYLKEEGTFGRAIVDNLKTAKDSYYSFTYNEKEYMVYDMSLVNNWISLSITDTTSAYAALKAPLIITIIVAVIAIGILLAVMINSGRKGALAERLSHENERAIAATKAKSAFLSNMSHEIRTPINAILGMNEMVLRESRDTGILEYSESIKTAGHTLLGLVNDILDFSKIEAGKIEIIPVDYDLSSLINDLVNMIQTRVDEKGLTLKLSIDSNIPKLLNGDDVRIKQVITNILTNAVKFTDRGSVTFSMGYERIPDNDEAVILKVSVQDTGIGIREEDREKIFAEFERVEEEHNRHIEGTGLGMSITRGLLGMMGSALRVESEYGKGSTFSFDLKQKVIKWEPIEDYQTAYQERVKDRKVYKEKFTAPDARVLVVDDNRMNLTVFKALIKQTRVKVDLANDGKECLVRSARKKYDIIFLDHMMPGMDGIETFHEMRADKDNPNLDTPVICLTANAISGSREKYMAEGFDDYMSKPIDAIKLEEMLMEYLPAEKTILTAAEDEDKGSAGKELPGCIADLKNSSLIDVNVGLANCASVEDYISLLRVFRDNLDEKAGELEEAFTKGEPWDYAIKAHALKSSARTIGAAGFGEEAQRMEDAGKSGDFDYIKENHGTFMQEYREFKELLAKLDDPDKSEDRPVADRNRLNAVYNNLRRAAEDMDCDLIEEILDSMDGFAIPESDKHKWISLREAAGLFEYSRIIDILAE